MDTQIQTAPVPRILTAVIFAAAFITAVVLVGDRMTSYFDKQLKLEEKRIFIEAVDSCGKVATSTWVDAAGKTTTTEPSKAGYEQCLKDKGYR